MAKSSDIVNAEAMFTDFIKKQSDHALSINIPFEIALPIFVGLWRYHRSIYCPHAIGVQGFTDEQRQQAEVAGHDNADIYAFLKPIFEKIIGGRGCEAVGIVSRYKGCVIMRVGDDKFEIREVSFAGAGYPVEVTRTELITSSM